MVTKTYLPSNLGDSSDSSDSSDSRDSSDSSKQKSLKKKLFSPKKLPFSQKKIFCFTYKNIKLFSQKKISPKYLKTQIVMKLKNSNCDETQKLKL